MTAKKTLSQFQRECEEAAISLALREDIFDGDITTEATVSKSHKSKGLIRAKSAGVLAGLRVAKLVLANAERPVKVKVYKKDGDLVGAGDLIAEVTGFTETLLKYERTILNFMQRMSGIATEARRYSDQIKHTSARILDTRKTVPGLRFFDKEAVKLGGGLNHRIGLYDMVLIKDNHVDAAGSVTAAIELAKKYCKEQKRKVKIEVEVRTMAELQEALSAKPDIILIDNFSPSELKKAVVVARQTDPKILLEASGGVTMQSLKKIAESGVDFISVGALTHSVTAMDISMKIQAL